MITFKKFNHTFKIRNDDWEKLRKRFNPKNAVFDGDDWTIYTYCPLCERYDKPTMDCRGCPLSNFSGESESGCLNFFNKLFRSKEIHLGCRSYIWWHGDNNTSTCRQLKRLNKMMDEIEEQNRAK